MSKIIIGAIVVVLIGGGIYALNRKSPAVTPGPVATSTPSTNNGGGKVTIVPAEGEVTVGLGETAIYKGVLVTPLSVVEDSRCPQDVQCIQAGTVRVKVSVSLATGLGTTTPTVKLGEFITTATEKITFVRVTPAVKYASVQILPGEYRFTVKIEKITPPVVAAGCFVGGCSSQICSDEPGAISTCEWTESYACYQTARCERQSDGKCGWTETTTLRSCLNSAGAN